jgi:hypothetical protein
MKPDDRDVISFGRPRTGANRIAWAGANRIARAVVALLSVFLAIAIVVAVQYHGQVVALHRQVRNTSRGAVSPTSSRTPAPSIEVVNGNTLSFAVKGTAGAVVSVEYLRADHGRQTMWLSVATSGLPLGWSYSATAGKCLHGRPVSLTTTSAIPDRRSGILLLPLNGVHVSMTEVIWLDLKTAQGGLLGGIRGNLLVRQATTLGRPAFSGQPLVSLRATPYWRENGWWYCL